jgi:hypothetical protein
VVDRGDPADLCIECLTRPRLASLSRCASCVRAAAELDRQSRVAAEIRLVASEKSARESAAEAAEREAALETAATAILNDPVAIAALEAAGADLLQPINEDRRGYLKRVLANESDRASLEAATHRLIHEVEHGKHRFIVEPVNDRHRPAMNEAAEKLQRLLKAPLVRREDPYDQTRFADRSQKQTPRHEFGREKRTLTNRPKRR